ncbi:MAG: L,D-transpeptidase family protein [Planctomycetota bacterium]|nr:L,D-transpeptidase family protein [Planctomycetota bacterium]
MSKWPWGVLVLGVVLIGFGAAGYILPHFRGSLEHASADPAGDVPSITPSASDAPSDAPPSTPSAVKPPAAQVPAQGVVGPVAPTRHASGPAATQAASTQSSSTQPGSPFSRGMKLIELGNSIEGRQVLSQALADPGLDAYDAQAIRDTLASVNRSLIFSKTVTPGDPLTEAYVVQPGDYLSRIAPKHKIPYEFLEIVNNTPANRIRLGQKLKLVHGPFEAVVSKSAYRMDMFLPGPDGVRLYIRSFQVGLGESGSTPLGKWLVKSGGKVKNPAWTNPRTNESYSPTDPKNPIGKYWLALEGLDESNKKLQGYGVHGTIDPDSIGKQASMGCVRLRDDDIAMVYTMLSEGLSEVTIVP